LLSIGATLATRKLLAHTADKVAAAEEVADKQYVLAIQDFRSEHGDTVDNQLHERTGSAVSELIHYRASSLTEAAAAAAMQAHALPKQ